MIRRVGFVALAVLLASGEVWAPRLFDLPKLPKPARFGNLLIDRLSTKNRQKAVSFSHWSHRLRHTCRVCHFELGFAMATNTTEITEASNRAGEYCGACHNGEAAFAHSEPNCRRCHSGDIDTTGRELKELSALPRAPFGNEIDWTEALAKGLIQPQASILDPDHEPLPFDKSLVLEAEWAMIPPAVFPHAAHTPWLDCADCHPDLFNVKKKTTEHFEMRYILDGKFCGVCHLRVAFPLDDCKRCHPAMRG